MNKSNQGSIQPQFRLSNNAEILRMATAKRNQAQALMDSYVRNGASLFKIERQTERLEFWIDYVKQLKEEK